MLITYQFQSITDSIKMSFLHEFNMLYGDSVVISGDNPFIVTVPDTTDLLGMLLKVSMIADRVKNFPLLHIQVSDSNIKKILFAEVIPGSIQIRYKDNNYAPVVIRAVTEE